MFNDIFELFKQLDVIVTDIHKNERLDRITEYLAVADELDNKVRQSYALLPEHIQCCYTIHEFEQAFQMIYRLNKYSKGGTEQC